MICSCWRPRSLHGIRRGEHQRHSPLWAWSSHAHGSRFPPLHLPFTHCHLLLLDTRFCSWLRYSFFFSTWLSILSVVNAKRHLRLICGIWFWLCHFGQDPSLLEGPVYISVSGMHLMTWQPPSFPDLNTCVSTGCAGRLGKYGPLCSHVRLESASLMDNGWTEWVKRSLDMTRFTYLDPRKGSCCLYSNKPISQAGAVNCVWLPWATHTMCHHRRERLILTGKLRASGKKGPYLPRLH